VDDEDEQIKKRKWSKQWLLKRRKYQDEDMGFVVDKGKYFLTYYIGVVDCINFPVVVLVLRLKCRSYNIVLSQV